jgi:peptidylprolyl isomerase
MRAMQSLAGGKVQFSDLVVGSGAVPQAGHTVLVAYKGTLAASGKVFDESERFSFRLGVGQVIRGWDEGVAGMREGGRRLLVIHPSLAYGARGAPPTIPPNAVLKFVVTLISAGKKKGAGRDE